MVVLAQATELCAQAADAADLLYMVGSFYYYAGEWKALEVEELSTATSSERALYAITATKLSNR